MELARCYEILGTSKKKRIKKEKIELEAEINNLEIKRKIQRINQTKSLFFEKINKVDKPLA